MQTAKPMGTANDAHFAEQRRAAYGYINEAFAEGRHDGIDGDCLAHAALFAAFVELVATYGDADREQMHRNAETEMRA